MSEGGTKNVLWIDDDEPDRFIYETAVLQHDGWTVTWERDVTPAAGRLAEQPFDALILDQMIAGSGVEEQFLSWAGCRLLRWLRGAVAAPLSEAPSWAILDDLEPLAENRKIPAVILSAYHNEEILRETQGASPADREIVFLSKPVDIERLRDFLRKIRGEKGKIA